MERVFIQKIFQITERVLRNEGDREATAQELHNHLAKARKLNMPLYEVEVLNTLGILSGNVDETIRLWQDALAKVIPLNNVDVHLKLLTNLAGLLIQIRRFDDAYVYMQQSLELVEHHQIKTIATLYVYGIASNYYMALGQYTEAEHIRSLFWKIAQNASLENYSRYEYAQILTTMWANRVELDIVARDEAAYQSDIKTLASFVDQMKRTDFDDMLKATHLYHSVIMDGNEAAALAHEETLRQANGHIPPTTLIDMAIFLHHNQQPTWAKKYAQQVVDQSGADDVIDAMIAQAQEILSA